MGVTQTPNILLNKPDETELAENWVNFTQLQAANNTAFANACNFPITSYTPTLQASTTIPNIGAGSIRGAYQDFMKFVTAEFNIEFIDPGVTAGSGVFAVSLPFPVDNSFHTVGGSFSAAPGTFSVIGEGYLFDSSTVSTSGFCALDVVTVAGVSYVRMLTELFTAPAKTSQFMRDAMPFTLATGDCFIGSVFYKRT